MKNFEIILKVVFLICGVYFIYSFQTVSGGDVIFQLFVFSPFILVSLILGIVLYFNKKQSYGYKLSKREIDIRKIEGVFLVIFSMTAAAFLYSLLTSLILPS